MLYLDGAHRRRARGAYEDAVRVARDMGSVYDLAMLLVIQARELPPEESARAFAQVEEGLELGTRIRNAIVIASAAATRGWIAVGLRDWPLALETSVDTVEQFIDAGAVALAAAGMGIAGLAFCSLGSFEVAAVLFGTYGWASANWLEHPSSHELFVAADAAIVDALGEQRVAELTARGAAMDMNETVAFLRAEVERVLADDDEELK